MLRTLGKEVSRRKVDVEISKLSAFNKRSSHSSSHAQMISNSLGL
jgi:hypothetical protein